MEILICDVLVIGAGAAGLRAAIAACQEGADVVLVAADKITYGGSTFTGLAPGWGIQALIGDERTPGNLEDFYDDIMRVGLDQCDPELVRILAEESGPRTEDLMSYGILFKKDFNGDYIRAKGCFSRCERAFLTEDIGNVRLAFLSILHRLPVRIVTGYAMDLSIYSGECLGARIVLKSGTHLQINAKSTVLATGGAIGIFRDHLGDGGGFGDGYALAYRAGAELKNMEFIQFAMGLKKNGTRQFLPIAELQTPDTLKTPLEGDLLKKYIPDARTRTEIINKRKEHMPFSCRDSSALVDFAVGDTVKSGEKVYWQTGNSKDDPFEVAHFAHAFNGGVKINAKAESTLPGLYAAGEVAAGAYGADRIGGCMMTATQVFGKRAGQFATQRARRMKTAKMPVEPGLKRLEGCPPKASCPEDRSLMEIADGIREKMQAHMSILRSEEGLQSCLNHLEDAYGYLADMKNKASISLLNRIKIRNMITVAKLVVQSALARKESLGAHFREDFSNL